MRDDPDGRRPHGRRALAGDRHVRPVWRQQSQLRQRRTRRGRGDGLLLQRRGHQLLGRARRVRPGARGALRRGVLRGPRLVQADVRRVLSLHGARLRALCRALPREGAGARRRILRDTQHGSSSEVAACRGWFALAIATCSAGSALGQSRCV